MLLLGFLLTSTLLNVILGTLVQFRAYQSRLRLTILSLSALFTAHIWVAYFTAFAATQHRWFLMNRVLLLVELAVGLAVLELTRRFLRTGKEHESITLGARKISLFTLAWIGTAVAAVVPLLPGRILLVEDAAETRIFFTLWGLLLPALHLLVTVFALYLLENTYRFARDFQRRIGRLCFIGLACILGFQVLFIGRVLLYHVLPVHFAEASSVVYGVVYPLVLAGFLRYRLGSERISIPRDTIYTSFTLLLLGASFLGIAATVLGFRWLHLDFSYFEVYLLGFTLSVLAVLVLGSGTMRRRISRFVNRQLYSRKYDYREQFFNLHRTLLSGADVRTALTELVDNMKYSVTVDDAYVFVLNWQDGNFYQHENKEESTRRGLVISGDSPLARQLAKAGMPVDLMASSEATRTAREAVHSEPMANQLRMDAVFPVFIDDGSLGERLVGILALQGGRDRPFDEEDLALISVFTNSIGDTLFKSRVLKDRIEQKQFESFHHVSSFIIHDIKNQIATLSLLLRNAERNLGNPSFQASMMSSIKSCSANLQGLIDRLAVAPKSEAVNLSAFPLRALLEEVVSNSGLASLGGIAFELRGEDHEAAQMDRQALFFVVRNLVNNSLEAMPGGGRLALSFGPLGPGAPNRLRELFGGGERFFAGYGAFILVEDSGAGMDKEFVQRRLFQPFATTKEKGVGIGLYQCKTLIEKMGGGILCHSELGKGTEFCILLPAPAPA